MKKNEMDEMELMVSSILKTRIELGVHKLLKATSKVETMSLHFLLDEDIRNLEGVREAYEEYDKKAYEEDDKKAYDAKKAIKGREHIIKDTVQRPKIKRNPQILHKIIIDDHGTETELKIDNHQLAYLKSIIEKLQAAK